MERLAAGDKLIKVPSVVAAVRLPAAPTHKQGDEIRQYRIDKEVDTDMEEGEVTPSKAPCTTDGQAVDDPLSASPD